MESHMQPPRKFHGRSVCHALLLHEPSRTHGAESKKQTLTINLGARVVRLFQELENGPSRSSSKVFRRGWSVEGSQPGHCVHEFAPLHWKNVKALRQLVQNLFRVQNGERILATDAHVRKQSNRKVNFAAPYHHLGKLPDLLGFGREANRL